MTTELEGTEIYTRDSSAILRSLQNILQSNKNVATCYGYSNGGNC
jgi:hypothetical protein